jgi:hypothetical protein
MLMRPELLNGGLPGEEFVELTPRTRGLLSARLRLRDRKTHCVNSCVYLNDGKTGEAVKKAMKEIKVSDTTLRFLYKPVADPLLGLEDAPLPESI